MARTRMTQRSRKATKDILADIDALERRMEAGIDEELSSWSDDIAKEERGIAQKSTGENTDAATGGQNGKANDNWPTNAAELSRNERTALAAELTELAKGMAKRIAANGSLTQGDREFVAKRLLKAAKRVGKV